MRIPPLTVTRVGMSTTLRSGVASKNKAEGANPWLRMSNTPPPCALQSSKEDTGLFQAVAFALPIHASDVRDGHRGKPQPGHIHTGGQIEGESKTWTQCTAQRGVGRHQLGTKATVERRKGPLFLRIDLVIPCPRKYRTDAPADKDSTLVSNNLTPNPAP